MMQSEHNHTSVLLQLEWIGSLHATQVETLSAILTTVWFILLTEGLSFNEMGNQPFKYFTKSHIVGEVGASWRGNQFSYKLSATIMPIYLFFLHNIPIDNSYILAKKQAS